MKKNLNDAKILERYKEVFQQFSRDGIIDMDKKLKHKFGFQIQRAEDVVPQIKGIVPPNRQSVYYITFIKKGAGEKSVGLFNFPIARNTLFLIPQRVIHSTLYHSMDCSGYILNFNIEFFLNNAFPKEHIEDKKVFKSSLRPYLVVTAAQRKKLETIFEYIITENAVAPMARNEMIAIKILELLILCDRFFSDATALGEESIYHPTVEKFTALIDRHFMTHRNVQFYADVLNVHPSHLNHLVKIHNGISAKKTIDNRIMLEAKYLLSNTDYAIKEIAHQLGFVDVNYFSSFFRKLTGQSPLQYRQEVHGA